MAVASVGHMQNCISPRTHNHTSIPPLSFLQAGCPSCCPTNSVKAQKAYLVPCHGRKTAGIDMNWNEEITSLSPCV